MNFPFYIKIQRIPFSVRVIYVSCEIEEEKQKFFGNAIHFCRHSRAVASIHKEMNYKKQVIMSSEESGSGYRQKRV